MRDPGPGDVGARSQSREEGRQRHLGLQFTNGASGSFPQAVIRVIQQFNEDWDRLTRRRAQLAYGTGGIARDGVFLNAITKLARPPLTHGSQQQRKRVWMLTAMATQPPGGVVLSRRIISCPQPPQSFRFIDGISHLKG
jgi:hypothetical protein